MYSHFVPGTLSVATIIFTSRWRIFKKLPGGIETLRGLLWFVVYQSPVLDIKNAKPLE